jgi:hypothetical protein
MTVVASAASVTALAALAALAALSFTVIVAARSTFADVGHDSTLGHRSALVKNLALVGS